MAQKVITVILVLIVLGGLAWYFNKTYLQSSTSPSIEKVPQFKTSSSAEGVFKGKLIFVVRDPTQEIWGVDTAKAREKFFTDADETEKIIKISNLAPFSKEVFAITSTEPSSSSGKLVAIDLKTAKMSPLLKNFEKPSAWTISLDGQKIAFTKFSNLEENYGYTLYSIDRGGANLRELAKSDSEIKTPSWNQNVTKIAFIKSSETKSQINITDTGTAKTTEIKSFENKIIDWLAWSNDRLVFSLRALGATNEGVIEIIDSSGKNLEKIIDFEGGIANFAYLADSAWLGFLTAQYQNQIDDSTTGQIYIVNPKGEKIPIQKGSQILGWLLES